MGLKVAVNSIQWSQPSVPHSPFSSQTLASAVSSPSKCRSFFSGDRALFCRYVDKSALFLGAKKSSNKLYRSQSRVGIMRRAITASLNSFSDEEFSKQIQELETRFENSDEAMFLENMKPFDTLEPRDYEIIPANIEWKANSFGIPLSLRIIKRKKQWQEGLMEVRESAYCSMKKAFSSMVFIIQELHSYTLQMREVLFYEDLQGILASVQKEIQASFVWLFQKVFSQTPTLMVYVMILLANYSVYSMSNNAALAATPLESYGVATEQVSVVEDHKFDSSVFRTLKLSSSNGKTISVGGNNSGGGGKCRPVASGTDGDGTFDESKYHSTITPDGVLNSNPSRSSGSESVSSQVSIDEETSLWNSIVKEASRDEDLDQETKQRFVSPVEANIEDDHNSEYLRTELLYQTELAQEPNNTLMLANYAQFLYLVAHDFDRAEEYFKRATKVEPKDAEALNKYANFLWMVRKDLWSAEETYLEAISAEPHNSYYAANYAHFLWNTGGEDTCFPLNSPDSTIDM